jgi:hypothetical protein
MNSSVAGSKRRNRQRVGGRALSVTILLTLVFSLLSLGGSVAIASEGQHGCHHIHKGNAPKGHGKFEPVAFEPYADDIDICGGITVTPGDISQVQSRVTVQRNGSTFYEYRGRTTNDIVAADGRKIDELDTGGSYSYLFAADNNSGILTVNGPALIYPFSAEEQGVFDSAGLPRAFYYRSGTLLAKTDGDGAITGFIKVPSFVSVCDLLKRASVRS